MIWLDSDDADVSTRSQQNVFDITSFRDVPKKKENSECFVCVSQFPRALYMLYFYWVLVLVNKYF